MKKHVFTIAAVLLAVGLSAFSNLKIDSATSTDTVWFLVDQDDVLTSSGEVSDDQASFVTKNGGEVPLNSCSSGQFYCLIGFTDMNKVSGSGTGPYSINGTEEPDITEATRN